MARSMTVQGFPRGGLVHVALCFGLAFASASCFTGYGRERNVSGVRSPSYDYQQQQRVAGGDVLGADGKAATDKLAEGPTQKTLSPGWSLSHKSGLSFDPNQRVGGSIDPPHEAEHADPSSPPQRSSGGRKSRQ